MSDDSGYGTVNTGCHVGLNSFFDIVQSGMIAEKIMWIHEHVTQPVWWGVMGGADVLHC
jgi:hypothetical protein